MEDVRSFGVMHPFSGVKMYHLLETPGPSSFLQGWSTVVEPFTEVIGWTSFGDFFLRNPQTGMYAFLSPSYLRLHQMTVRDREGLDALLKKPRFVEDWLRPDGIHELERRLGVLEPDEVFSTSAFASHDRNLDAYRKLKIDDFASLTAAHHNVGQGELIDFLLIHLRTNDDTRLWRIALEHILGPLPKNRGTLVEIGRCSHWLRPHQTRWTADGGFAWPAGYGSGTGGYSSDALPQFDWSVTLNWIGDRWEVARNKSAGSALRIAIPSRTRWHEQAAIHSQWKIGKEKECRFYGFRHRNGAWECTAETEWAEDLEVRSSVSGGRARGRK